MRILSLYFVLFVFLFGCNSEDEFGVSIPEKFELVANKSIICLGESTAFYLSSGDSIIDSETVHFSIEPSIGLIDENGVYTAPTSLEESTEIIVRANLGHEGDFRETVLQLDANSLEDQIIFANKFSNLLIGGKGFLVPFGEGIAFSNTQKKYDTNSELKIFLGNDSGKESFVLSEEGAGFYETAIKFKEHLFVGGMTIINNQIQGVVRKIDELGNMKWEKLMVDKSIQDIYIDNGGVVHVLSSSAAENEEDGRVVNLMKLGQFGNELYQANLDQSILGMAFGKSGEVFKLYNDDGVYLSKVDQDLKEESWKIKVHDRREFSHYRMVQISQSGEIWVFTGENPANNYSWALNRYSVEGKLIAKKVYSSNSRYRDVQLIDVNILENGDALLTGWGQAYNDVSSTCRVILIDSNGDVKWEWKNNGADGSWVSGIAAIKNEKGYLIYANVVSEEVSTDLFYQLNEEGKLSPCAQEAS
ncbi:hypothetical protein [Echinicola sp. 20G]|uniref:hypothetical protein n=1 Tax=Echinicola sp. 20G TaxID=2781961 RepID=UPI0019109BB2|nr:hypothetical protein [Echinicola sp. 20G]